MFIKLDKNNEILEVSEIQIDDTSIKTDKSIIRNYLGKLIFFEDLEEDKELEHAKEIKLIEAKIKNEEYLYFVYPQYRQNNLAIFGTTEEREAFKKFKEEQVILYDNLCNQIRNITNKYELNQIELVFSNEYKSIYHKMDEVDKI